MGRSRVALVVAVFVAAGSAVLTGAPHAAAPRALHPAVQQAELTASDGVPRNDFGASVAMSGNTAVIGAPWKRGFAGAAYVFTSFGGVWTQQAKLVASDGAFYDSFGTSVAILGTTIVVVGPATTRDRRGVCLHPLGGNWSQQAELTLPDGASNDEFGGAVAVSGTTALVGATGRDTFDGAAYIFTGVGGVWTQRAELKLPDGVRGDEFGAAVALTGTAALIGAWGRDNLRGAAYVFTLSNGTWSQPAELHPHATHHVRRLRRLGRHLGATAARWHASQEA